jgi:hypothetical protein
MTETYGPEFDQSQTPLLGERQREEGLGKLPQPDDVHASAGLAGWYVKSVIGVEAPAGAFCIPTHAPNRVETTSMLQTKFDP